MSRRRGCAFLFGLMLTWAVFAAAGAARAGAACLSSVTASFSSTGAEQCYVVPAGETVVHVIAVGAHGGDSDSNSSPGNGARVTADIPVTGGETLWVEVGANGVQATGGGGSAVFGGGGAAGSDAGDGGGASDLRTCSLTAASCAGGGTSLASRLLVAGGGGGAGLEGVNEAGGIFGAGSNGGSAAASTNAGVTSSDGAAGQSGETAGDFEGPRPGPLDGSGGGAGTAAGPGAGGDPGVGDNFTGKPGGDGTTGAGGSGGLDFYGGGGGGGGVTGGGGGGGGGEGTSSPLDIGGGGGGGGGSSFIESTASGRSISTDSSGTPTITIEPVPPTASITAPADGQTYAVGQIVGTQFSCSEGADGPGLTSCVDGAASASPGVLNTSKAGTFTYTVTATSGDGETGSATIHYKVAAAPTASITSPADHASFAKGTVVATAFSCAEGASGPGISSCVDSNGASSPGALDTSTPGVFAYTVTATSADGQTGTATIGYTVTGPPTATITAPGNNETFAVGEVVPTHFSCQQGLENPGLASCTDASGASSPGALDTSTPGTFAYTVTAVGGDGQMATASIDYTVAAAPTASIATPADGQTFAIGQAVSTHFSCADGADGPGIVSCTDGSGASSPGALDTSKTGSFTYTVTAVSGDGQLASTSISYTVAAAPSATITAPATGQVFAIGQKVATGFNCSDGADGPGIASCTDGSGASSPGALDTSKTGTFTYTVTAVSADGQQASTSITYTVAAAPSASITAPASGQVYAIGQKVATAFGCAEGTSGTGLASCRDAGGGSSPGTLDTSKPGAFSYTVTAASKDGQTATASISYTVAAAPTPSISSPATGQTFTVGQTVATAFSCADGTDGPGISTCTDGSGSASPGSLNTSTTGSFTYTVTATSKDGQTATTNITYTVVAPTPTPIPTPSPIETSSPVKPTPPSNLFSLFAIHASANGTITFKVKLPGAGTVDVLETAWNDNLARAAVVLQPASGRFATGRSSQPIVAAGTETLRVRPNAKGRQLVLHHRYAVVLRLWVSFTPTGGTVRTIGVHGIHPAGHRKR